MKIHYLGFLTLFVASSSYADFPGELVDAIKKGDFNQTKALIERAKSSAELNLHNKEGTCPLAQAAMLGQKNVVELLLDRGANVHETTQGSTSLFLAAKKGHLDVVELLIKRHANPHQTNSGGSTPLLVSASNGHSDIVQFLLEKAHVDANQTTRDGKYSPILFAADVGNPAIVKLLLDHGAGLESPARSHLTPLRFAMENSLKSKEEATKQRYRDVLDLLFRSGRLNISAEIALALKVGDNKAAEEIVSLFNDYFDYFGEWEKKKKLSAQARSALTFEQRFMLRMGCDLEDADCPICTLPVGSDQKKKRKFKIGGVAIDAPSHITFTACKKALCPPCMEKSVEATNGKCPFCKEDHDNVEIPVPARPEEDRARVSDRKGPKDHHGGAGAGGGSSSAAAAAAAGGH